jgi:hypothetical protein
VSGVKNLVFGMMLYFLNELGFFHLFLKWIPTLTLPFLRGGDTVEPSSTGFPPLKKGRVRVGIQNRKFKKINLN